VVLSGGTVLFLFGSLVPGVASPAFFVDLVSGFHSLGLSFLLTCFVRGSPHLLVSVWPFVTLFKSWMAWFKSERKACFKRLQDNSFRQTKKRVRNRYMELHGWWEQVINQYLARFNPLVSKSLTYTLSKRSWSSMLSGHISPPVSCNYKVWTKIYKSSSGKINLQRIAMCIVWLYVYPL